MAGQPDSGDPNNPGLSISTQSPGHRFFSVGSYSRDFFKFGATTVSVYFESRTIGNVSYVFNGDANGDGGIANDLIYVPRDQSEMYFQTIPASGSVPSFTPAQQAAAWDAYIEQDPYLSTRRGQYAERNAFFLPLVHRADMSVSQDFGFDMGGQRHSFQFRMDIDNFSNLLNSDWGVSQRLVNNQPLTNPSMDAQGRLQVPDAGRQRRVDDEDVGTDVGDLGRLQDHVQLEVHVLKTGPRVLGCSGARVRSNLRT